MVRGERRAALDHARDQAYLREIEELERRVK